MGKRGPKPTPTSVLSARGSWRANVRTNEPEADTTTPSCPSFLTDDAKSVWHFLVPLLKKQNTLACIDRCALSRYCATLALWHECLEDVKINGQVDEDTGKINNAARLLQQHESTLSRLEKDFGMTPSARAGLAHEVDETLSNTKARFFTANNAI